MNGPHHPQQGQAGPPKIAGMPTIKAEEVDLEPIDLVDHPVSSQKIKAFGGELGRQAHSWKRTPVVTGRGAVRVRTFHGKMSDQGLGFLDDTVNHWLDDHPEVEVKLVTTTVGQFEGKIREPAIVVNIWY